jgi:hypothetical protein
MGDKRYPPLQEAEVKVTNITKDVISGVMRETAEPVDCFLAEVTIDTLPLFSHYLSSPRPLALAKPGERIPLPKEAIPEYEMLNVEVSITGICDNTKGGQETLVDRVSEIVSAKKTREGWDLTVVSKAKKEAFNCKSSLVSVKKKESENKESEALALNKQDLAKEESYVNKIILVTGDCAPYKSALDTSDNEKDKVLFIPMTDSPVKVRTNTFKDGKLARFTGIATMIDGNPLVDCDMIKNKDITFRNFDPSTQKLIKMGK